MVVWSSIANVVIYDRTGEVTAENSRQILCWRRGMNVLWSEALSAKAIIIAMCMISAVK